METRGRKEEVLLDAKLIKKVFERIISLRHIPSSAMSDKNVIGIISMLSKLNYKYDNFENYLKKYCHSKSLNEVLSTAPKYNKNWLFGSLFYYGIKDPEEYYDCVKTISEEKEPKRIYNLEELLGDRAVKEKKGKKTIELPVVEKKAPKVFICALKHQKPKDATVESLERFLKRRSVVKDIFDTFNAYFGNKLSYCYSTIYSILTCIVRCDYDIDYMKKMAAKSLNGYETSIAEALHKIPAKPEEECRYAKISIRRIMKELGYDYFIDYERQIENKKIENKVEEVTLTSVFLTKEDILEYASLKGIDRSEAVRLYHKLKNRSGIVPTVDFCNALQIARDEYMKILAALKGTIKL